MNLLAISGSLRAGSYNTALIKELARRAPEGVSIAVAAIGGLPLYSQDLETPFPDEAAALKALIRAADGVIIATPEHNRSVPSAIKNAVDWTSRPYGDSAWDGKPVCTMGASVGNIGTAVAQYALKQSLLYLNARVLGQPEFYLGRAQEKFDEAGNLIDAVTGEHLDKMLAAFVEFAKAP